MRDIALTLLLFGSIPFILVRPTLGVLVWVWISVMSPHRLTWSFAYEMPWALLIAIATLVGLFFSREPKRLPVTPVTVVLLLLVLWMNITTVFAIDTALSMPMWERVMKIQFMVFVTLFVLNSKDHVKWLIWVLALSVAFFGIKGGLFTLREGGVYRVYGPSGSFIEENNALALAVIMTIPMLQYLRLQAASRWMRWGLLAGMLLCGFSALGSQSRGALLSVGAMLSAFWLKTRNKLITAFILVLLVPAAINFMPKQWDARMSTIENYERDVSAMGRINAWKTAVNLANDRPLVGGGFEFYSRTTFALYAPDPTNIHSAHSIYFQMLGEHGYVGLALYLLLWLLVWRDASWIIRQARTRDGWQWASDLSRMIQVALAGFAVGGAFLNLAYYDVPYYLLAAIVLTRVLLEKEVAASEQKARFPSIPQTNGAKAGDRPALAPTQFKPPMPADKRG
jgi:putative inorganic carbon (HCO3(-)) transporter